MNKNTRSPLFHVAKRGALPWYRAWAVRGAALLLALVLCGILTSLVTKLNPMSVYAAIWKGSFGTSRKFWVLLQNIAMLLCVSLAVTPAFRMRCWNLGAEGQALIGALASAACMILLPGKIPNWAVIVCMAVTSILAGAIWAGIPAFFKAKWNTNETLFTLMMNYVATQLVAYYCVVWESPKGSATIGIINSTTEVGWFPVIGGQKYLLNILIVAVTCVAMFVYLRYSKHGYEIAVVGESERTARYVGIKVERVIIRTMLLSGAICGLAGLLLVGGTNHTLTPTIVDGRGFTAVMVSWLAKFPAGLPREGRRRNHHQLRPEPLLRRHPDRHHPVLHHRQRVLHQLPDQVHPQRQKGGMTGV